ncbi:MAG: hypothetical protein ACPGSB_06035 [Opitutales bacterium]
MPGWSTVTGSNIEIQAYADPNGEENTYCELKAHPQGHLGIKQQVGTRIGQTYLLVFDCATKQDVVPGQSNFDLSIDGTIVQNIPFTEHTTNWESKIVAFVATRTITEIAFFPTGDDNTKGALLDNVELLKVDLDPVYGDGPDGIGYCPNSIADGNVSCEFVGADYEDLNINSPINQIPNPAAILIESSANDENVAVFMIKTDLDDAEAEKVFHWVIEQDGNGGSASFYPPNGNDNNKRKEVKISGSSSGRVMIEVYAGEPNPNAEPVVFTEALVVHKKLLPYRANIVTYEGNTDQVLPSSPTDIQNSMNVANVIVRQAGIELLQSTNTDDGDMTYVHSPLPGENGEVIQY